MPVVTPQPSIQTVARSAALSILATAISGTTVYSAKVEQPMKWCTGVPSASARRVVPSGMTPLPCVPRILGQRLVLGDMQKMHLVSEHWGV